MQAEHTHAGDGGQGEGELDMVTISLVWQLSVAIVDSYGMKLPFAENY